jgi:hypothetical protein
VNDRLQASLASLNVTGTLTAGSPGRYLLPDAPRDQLAELAGVLDAVHRMARTWTVYSILQSFILVFLIARQVSAARATMVELFLTAGSS